MPKWIHNRARHLLAKNPDMDKSQAFAVATEQSHKIGKTPKGYGTSEGKKKARQKYDKPRKEYTKGANPGDLETPKLSSMREELEKEALALKNLSYMGKRLAGGTALAAAGGAAAGAAAPAAANMATKAASSISPEQLKVMREAIDDNVPQARSIKKMQQFVQDWKEKQSAGLSGDNPYLLDQIGKPKQRKLDAMPPNKKLITKQAFTMSQYSGMLGPGGRVKHESHIPPFVNPPVKTAGPPSEEKDGKEEKAKSAAMLDEFAKLNAIQSPQKQITKAQKIGTPKASGPPGPSIQQLSKPLGFGKPIPGAIKPQQGI